jgi:aldehyde:ferredoxin oxidoreductase
LAIDSTLCAEYLLCMRAESDSPPINTRRNILVIDLEEERYERIMLTEVEAHELFGGRLLALSLWKQYAQSDGLAPSEYERGNPIVIAPGPAGEIGIEDPSSFVIVTRNPVSGRIGIDVGSSVFGEAILGLGYVAVVIVGRSRRLGAITINEEGIHFSSAEELYDLGAGAVGRRIKRGYLLVSGPAGDRYSPYASLVAAGQNVGRGGVGAVFGRKNLKYLNFDPPELGREVQDVHRLGKYNRRWARRRDRSKVMSRLAQYGSLALIDQANRHGWAGIDGWTGRFDGRLWALADQVEVGSRLLDLPTAVALGPNLGVFETEHIIALAQRCTELGLDPVATSALINWARFTREEGLLTFLSDFKGSAEERYEPLFDALAYGRGTAGAALTKPLDQLVERYGGGQYAYLVQKMPLWPFDLRALPANALLTAMGDQTIVYGELLRGNRHRRGNEGRLARRARFAQVLTAAAQCVGVHSVALAGLSSRPLLVGKRQSFLHLAKVASLSEGRDISVSQLIDYGRRALVLEAEINTTLGATFKAHLPEQLLIDGKSHFKKIQVVPLIRLLDAYYSLRSREKRGEPPAAG